LRSLLNSAILSEIGGLNMEKKIEINANQFVRDIRDRHTKIIKGKSNEEIITFFKETAKETNDQLQHLQVRKSDELIQQ
jgi:hypothetical protein